MAKIDLSGEVTGFDGAPLMRPKPGGSEQPWTYGAAAAEAVLTTDPKQPARPANLVERHLLAQQLHAGGEVELSAEQVVMIKNGAALAFRPVLAGPLILRIDPNAAKAPG